MGNGPSQGTRTEAELPHHYRKLRPRLGLRVACWGAEAPVSTLPQYPQEHPALHGATEEAQREAAE